MYRSTCLLSHLQFDLEKFWQIEEPKPAKIISQEDKLCEKYFRENTYRNSNGRFVVSLPFKNNRPELGDSRNVAMRRMKSLLKRFKSDTQFAQQYAAVMQVYIDLNHMSLIDSPSKHFLAHHAVCKTSSLTTKLRIVFDPSAKTTNNLSLNDALMVGPTIQDDLFALLTRFDFIITSSQQI